MNLTQRVHAVTGWLFAPAADYGIAVRWFLRALALIYFAAFASLGVQITGLAGEQGILPFGTALESLRQQAGTTAYWQFPNLFWIDSSDLSLKAAAVAGCLFATLLLFNRLPRISLAMLFVLYLSLFHAGQIYMNFQWDYLLLEAGFLALLLSINASRLVIWLFHWLLFRLRFESGIAKMLSGDQTWRDFSALRYYFETQPLPHRGAWYAHHLPEWILAPGVGLVLFAELLVPFLLFLPRRFRLFAGMVTLLTQLLILATSNHNWFNLLTIALCLFLFDDRALGRVWPFAKHPGSPPGIPEAGPSNRGRPGRWLTGVSAAVIFAASSALLWGLATQQRLPHAMNQAVNTVRAFGLTQRYHVFPTIRTERLEVELQGSADGLRWRRYDFRYKPGEPAVPPAFIVPHQPRLDWMMWFVTLSLPMNARWLEGLVQRLFENAPPVTALLASNPFSDAPPRFIRAEVYRYRFTTPEEKAETGNWWVREPAGPLLPMPWVNPAAVAATPGGRAFSAPRPPPPARRSR